MKKFLIILLIMLFGQMVYALDVVYPRKNIVTINSPSSFFIGSANPKQILIINGVQVKVHPSGGFAHVIMLNEGENKFVLQSGHELKTYIINRPKFPSTFFYVPPKLIEYEKKKEFLTSIDNAPLRTTPVDGGINRMSHFEKNIPLTVDAEKNNFYRVVLGGDKKAWIAKSNVKTFYGFINSPAVINGFERKDDEEYFKIIFHLNKKTPYEIIEGETFTLKFFNVKDCPDNTYIFSFPYKENTNTPKLAGYSGSYDGNDFILKIRKFPVVDTKHPLKNITIAIDAGHGGKEFGAIGCCGDKEKDITLNIAKHLQHELKKRGANVIMTRSDDSFVELSDRVDIANKNNAMFLISIHGNSLGDQANPNKHRGTSIYYYYNQAKPLAANVLIEMTKQLGTKNDNIRQGSLALVRNTNALSILIEVAYLINPEDNALLITPHFQKQCAKAIADGIGNFLKN